MTMTSRVLPKWLPVLAILPCACTKTDSTTDPVSEMPTSPGTMTRAAGGTTQPSAGTQGAAGATAAGHAAVGGAGAGGDNAPAQQPTAGSAGSSGSLGEQAPELDASVPMDGGLDAGQAADAATTDAAVGDDLCSIGNDEGQAPMRLRLSGNTFAHDPTMIEADGTYYRFWTGDNTPVATSTDLMSWTNAPSVYRNGYPAWSREWLAGVPGETFNFPWAPDVSYFNGKYHLYVSFSAKFGDNISCITHLSTSDIAAGDWTDHGPVICTKGNENYNAIDADVGLDVDGKPYLSFGSFWDGIMAFPLTPEGDREGTELTRLAWAREIEAPVLFRRCGYYYLFVSHGLCCPGQNRTVDQLSYRILVGRSKDILGPYVDREGKALVDGGGTLVVKGDNTYAAAGHSDIIVTRGHIYQLYHAYRRPRGDAELRINELLFDAEGWPVPSAP